MEFIDTHTHLNDDVYNGGADAVVAALESGVRTMILPGTSLDEIPSMLRLYSMFTENIKMFAGLHPTELTENPDAALNVVFNQLENNTGEFVGVGEIGIDLHEDGPAEMVQMDAFYKQCHWALQFNLPINIHCREGLNQTLEVLASLPEMPKGAFHCFGGTPEDVARIRSAGDFFFGINGIVTFKNSGLASTIPAIGLDRIVLETDAPYLSPVPFRGKINDSSRIPVIAQKIAEILNVPLERVADVTTANARKLYSL